MLAPSCPSWNGAPIGVPWVHQWPSFVLLCCCCPFPSVPFALQLQELQSRVPTACQALQGLPRIPCPLGAALPLLAFLESSCRPGFLLRPRRSSDLTLRSLSFAACAAAPQGPRRGSRGLPGGPSGAPPAATWQPKGRGPRLSRSARTPSCCSAVQSNCVGDVPLQTNKTAEQQCKATWRGLQDSGSLPPVALSSTVPSAGLPRCKACRPGDAITCKVIRCEVN